MSALTISICTNNSFSYLRKCLISLVKQTNKEFNLIIQDNYSNNLNKKKVKEVLGEILDYKYIYKQCSGLSESRNICIKNCETEYIHFLDDDVFCPNNFVDNLKVFLSENKPVCVGGKVLPDWGGIVKPDWLTNNCLPFLSIVDFGYTNLVDPPFLAGANLCFKLEVLKDLGGFSQNLGRIQDKNCLLSGEETKVISLLKEQGLNHFYCPSFPVFHAMKKDRLTKKWLIKRAAWQAVSDFISNNYEAYEFKNESIKNHIYRIFSANSSNMDEVLFSVRIIVYKLLFGLYE